MKSVLIMTVMTYLFLIGQELCIYPTKKQVDEHNNKVLQYFRDKMTEMFTIKAQDTLGDATWNEPIKLEKINLSGS